MAETILSETTDHENRRPPPGRARRRRRAQFRLPEPVMDDNRIRWTRSCKKPSELITVREARRLLAETAASVAPVADCPPLACRGEFVNMVYGGGTLKAHLAQRVILAEAVTREKREFERL